MRLVGSSPARRTWSTLVRGGWCAGGGSPAEGPSEASPKASEDPWKMTIHVCQLESIYEVSSRAWIQHREDVSSKQPIGARGTTSRLDLDHRPNGFNGALKVKGARGVVHRE